MERSNPKPRDRAEDKLLRGTASAFAAKGSHALTVEDILTASGVSRPTFYKCFADKQAAVEAVVRAANRALVDALKAAVASAPTPPHKLAAAVDAYLDWGIEQGAFAARLYSEMGLMNSAASRERQRTLAAIARLIQREGSVLASPAALPDPLLLTALVTGIETLGSACFARPRTVPRARVRAHALRLMAAVLDGLPRQDEDLPVPARRGGLVSV